MFIYKQLPTEVVALEEENWKQEAYIEWFLIDNMQIFEKEDNEARFLERQITLEGKKRIDLLVLLFTGKVRHGVELRIVEIKKDKASIQDLNQLKEYINRWKQEGSQIMEREELVQKVKRYVEESGAKKEEIGNLNRNVKGVLVATAFDQKVKDYFKNSKEFEGIQIRRLLCNKLKESYIFIEYIPERRASLPISPEEFWMGPGTRRKHQVESVLEKVKKEIPEIVLEYWTSMISVYPSKEARASKKRIAKYRRGDNSMQVKIGDGAYQRIPLREESRIISETRKFKQE